MLGTCSSRSTCKLFFHVITPLEGTVLRAIRSSKVVFPSPFLPIRPILSPCLISVVMLLKILFAPIVCDTFCILHTIIILFLSVRRDTLQTLENFAGTNPLSPRQKVFLSKKRPQRTILHRL